MGLVSISFSLATVAALGFATWGRRNAPDAFHLALFFFAWFWVYEALRPYLTHEQLTSLDPALDALLGSICTLAWFRRPTRWRGWLIVTFAAQSALHVAFRREAIEPPDSYKIWVSVLHAAQLPLVSWEGGKRVGSRLLDLLLPTPRIRYRPGSSRAPRKIKGS